MILTQTMNPVPHQKKTSQKKPMKMSNSLLEKKLFREASLRCHGDMAEAHLSKGADTTPLHHTLIIWRLQAFVGKWPIFMKAKTMTRMSRKRRRKRRKSPTILRNLVPQQLLQEFAPVSWFCFVLFLAWCVYGKLIVYVISCSSARSLWWFMQWLCSKS